MHLQGSCFVRSVQSGYGIRWSMVVAVGARGLSAYSCGRSMKRHDRFSIIIEDTRGGRHGSSGRCHETVGGSCRGASLVVSWPIRKVILIVLVMVCL